jgi:hypothetical protein
VKDDEFDLDVKKFKRQAHELIETMTGLMEKTSPLVMAVGCLTMMDIIEDEYPEAFAYASDVVETAKRETGGSWN